MALSVFGPVGGGPGAQDQSASRNRPARWISPERNRSDRESVIAKQFHRERHLLDEGEGTHRIFNALDTQRAMQELRNDYTRIIGQSLQKCESPLDLMRKKYESLPPARF